MTEDDSKQKYISVKKSFAPHAYGSKTFTPSQLKMSTYTIQILAIHYAFKEFGHIFKGTPKLINIFTDNKSVKRFSHTKIKTPLRAIACNYAVQFNFIVSHTPGKNNTAADHLSHKKVVLKICEDVETRPMKVKVKSITEDDNETEDHI